MMDYIEAELTKLADAGQRGAEAGASFRRIGYAQGGRFRCRYWSSSAVANTARRDGDMRSE